jgi:hypothetical protein
MFKWNRKKTSSAISREREPKKKLWIRQISDLRFSAKETFALLIKEADSSETSVNVYQPT